MRSFLLRASGAALLVGMLGVPGVAADVATTARAVDDHYNSLKSFKAAFTEIYQAPASPAWKAGRCG